MAASERHRPLGIVGRSNQRTRDAAACAPRVHRQPMRSWTPQFAIVLPRLIVAFAGLRGTVGIEWASFPSATAKPACCNSQLVRGPPMHTRFQALHRFLRRRPKAVCAAATEFEFPRMVRFLSVITKILCPAWLTLLFFGLAFLEAKAGTGELAVRESELCGTFFDQQSVALPRGDAIFKRGRCIGRWIASEGKIVLLPPSPIETVQSALVQGPDDSIYLSGGRQYFGDPRFTSVDAKPKQSVYRWLLGSEAWSEAPRLKVARAKHASVTLPDGRILVIGGEGAPMSGNPFPTLSSVESLKPARTSGAGNLWGLLTSSWQAAPSLEEARSQPAALVTDAGDAIVIGGERSGAGLSSVEILPHGEQAWRRLASMHEGRYGHTATLLPDGRILVTGGLSARNSPIDRAEVWAPRPSPLGSWRTAGTMPGGPRSFHTATLLEDGRVLIIGGLVADGQDGKRTTAIWNPRDGSWRSDAALPEPPYRQGAFLQEDHSIVVLLSSPFRKIYNTTSTLAYRFRLLKDLTAVDILAEQAIAKGSFFVSNDERDSLSVQDRAGVVAKLLVHTQSENNATCRSAWDALESFGGSAYPEVIARAATVLNSVSCGSSPGSILGILKGAPEPLSPIVADQVAIYFEGRGDSITLAELARKRTLSLQAIARWLAPDHPRLNLAFEWLIAEDTLRFDATLSDLAGLVETEFDRLRREDPRRYVALASLRQRLAAKARAFPMQNISNSDGLPRDIEIRKAALYALDLGLIAGSSSTETVTKTEDGLADKLVQFVRESRPYLFDAREIATVRPGAGAPTFKMLALGSITRTNSFYALRVVRPAFTVAGKTQAAIAWDIIDDETLSTDDIETKYDPRSGYKNVTVRTSTTKCAEGRKTLRYDPARQEFVGPIFSCLRTAD